MVTVEQEEVHRLFRVETDLVVLYCLAYGLVFVVGLVGNLFVVVAVLRYPSMRTTTNWFILSLALADLLIVVFCLSSTLVSSIFVQWHMGDLLCRLTQWMNGATTCTSVYTLVAVTADRYFAICHSLRYSVWSKRWVFCIIVAVWFFSGLLFLPLFFFFRAETFEVENSTEVAVACIPTFPSIFPEQAMFLANSLIAFLIPLTVITICYVYIFIRIYSHQTLAVDRNAIQREQKMKLTLIFSVNRPCAFWVNITKMMLMVIVSFALSWFPLYLLFFYIYFLPHDFESDSWLLATRVLRPVFQWLSLASSCINPFLYIYFSARFRTAFHLLLDTPLMRPLHNLCCKTSSSRHGTPQQGGVTVTAFSVMQPGADNGAARRDACRGVLVTNADIHRLGVPRVARRFSATPERVSLLRCDGSRRSDRTVGGDSELMAAQPGRYGSLVTLLGNDYRVTSQIHRVNVDSVDSQTHNLNDDSVTSQTYRRNVNRATLQKHRGDVKRVMLQKQSVSDYHITLKQHDDCVTSQTPDNRVTSQTHADHITPETHGVNVDRVTSQTDSNVVDCHVSRL